MSVTYGVSGSSPFGDFTVDFEDLLIQYLYDEWSILDPAKPLAKQGIGQNIEFRPGFDRDTPTYQVLAIQTDTQPFDQDASRRSWRMITTCEITLIARRFKRDNIDPQLGYMEREIQRIINQYRSNDITGIVDLFYRGQSRIYDDIIAGGTRSPQIRGGTTSSSAVSTKYKTRIYVDMMYYKDDISTP